MALRRSSGSILKLGSVRRRSRGSGGSFDMTSAPRLYDMEYRQKTEDYRDEIISFDEYIAFLKEKEMGLKEGGHDRFTISKRIKDITTAYNKKAESEYKSEVRLEEQKYAEDYRNGLIGYEAFYPYLQEKADHFCGLDPNSSECFMATKKAEDVKFQQADREMDFMFNSLKTVSPDDYIAWKEPQMDGLDPNSNAYMQLYKDIESAKKEKVSRGKSDLEFDILIGEADKADLLKWYDDAIGNTDDPETKKKYFTQRCNLADSMDKELETAWRKERALEDKEAALKFRRGDFGDTDTENREGYYSFLNERYNTEHDPSRQMTYMGKMDTLVKQEEEAAESKYKKAVAAGKRRDKEMQNEFKATVKKVNETEDKMQQDLNRGIITPEEFAYGMWELVRGEEGLEADIFALSGQPISDGFYDLLVKESESRIEDQETEGFWKAWWPKVVDGKWTGELNPNPNFKAIQKFDDKNGNYEVSYLHDPDQSYELEGYIYDFDSKVYRKYDTVDMKDDDGNVVKVRGKAVKTKECFVSDKDGNTTKISFDEKTGDWMDERTGKARIDFWDVNPRNMLPEELANYLKKIGEEKAKRMMDAEFDSGKKGKMGEGLTGKAWDAVTGVIEGYYKGTGRSAAKGGLAGAAADVGSGIKDVGERMAAKGPIDMASDIINRTKEDVIRSAGEVPESVKTIWDTVRIGAEKKVGDVGEDVKLIQRNLNLKNVTGYWGPKTQKAYDQAKTQVKTQITSDFSEESFGRLGSDAGKIGKFVAGGITSAAKKMFENKIGGALGDVYAKRKDLQQHFDASGKGISAAWKGHTIQEWAERHGKHEEVSLKGGTFKAPTIQPPPQLKQFDFEKAREEILSRVSPLIDFGKDLFSPIQQAAQKARSRITSDFSKEKRKRLGSDVKTIKKYATQKAGGWLSKLKWWK